MAGSTERQPVIAYKSLTICPSLPSVILRSFETWIEVRVSDISGTPEEKPPQAFSSRSPLS